MKLMNTFKTAALGLMTAGAMFTMSPTTAEAFVPASLITYYDREALFKHIFDIEQHEIIALMNLNIADLKKKTTVKRCLFITANPQTGEWYMLLGDQPKKQQESDPESTKITVIQNGINFKTKQYNGPDSVIMSGDIIDKDENILSRIEIEHDAVSGYTNSFIYVPGKERALLGGLPGEDLIVVDENFTRFI